MAKLPQPLSADQLQAMENEAKAKMADLPEPELETVPGNEEPALEPEPVHPDRLDRLESRMEQIAALLAQLGSSPRILAPAPDQQVQPPTLTEEDSLRLVRLRVFSTNDNAAENRPVAVAVNGNSFTLQRDEDVIVPFCVVEALQHAVIESWEFPIENGVHQARKASLAPMTTSQPVHKVTPRFHYTYTFV